jgi:hypothetical protein
MLEKVSGVSGMTQGLLIHEVGIEDDVASWPESFFHLGNEGP